MSRKKNVKKPPEEPEEDEYLENPYENDSKQCCQRTQGNCSFTSEDQKFSIQNPNYIQCPSYANAPQMYQNIQPMQKSCSTGSQESYCQESTTCSCQNPVQNTPNISLKSCLSKPKSHGCQQTEHQGCGQKKQQSCCHQETQGCCQEKQQSCCQEKQQSCHQETQGCCQEKQQSCCHQETQGCCQEKQQSCCHQETQGCCQEKQQSCCHQETQGCCHEKQQTCCHKEPQGCCQEKQQSCCKKQSQGCCHQQTQSCCHQQTQSCCHQQTQSCCHQQQQQGCCQDDNYDLTLSSRKPLVIPIRQQSCETISSGCEQQRIETKPIYIPIPIPIPIHSSESAAQSCCSSEDISCTCSRNTCASSSSEDSYERKKKHKKKTKKRKKSEKKDSSSSSSEEETKKSPKQPTIIKIIKQCPPALPQPQKYAIPIRPQQNVMVIRAQNTGNVPPQLGSQFLGQKAICPKNVVVKTLPQICTERPEEERCTYLNRPVNKYPVPIRTQTCPKNVVFTNSVGRNCKKPPSILVKKNCR